MKNKYESIERSCLDKLAEQYPENSTPAFAVQRLEQELDYLKNSEALEDFALFQEISKCACRGGYPIVLNGTVAGSYLVYLLGDGLPNPLPAHYHCASCGGSELHEDVLVGADLPDKVCPSCGKPLRKDGFSLPIESVWDVDGSVIPSFEYRIPDELYPSLHLLFQNYYAGRIVLPCAVRDESTHHECDNSLWEPVRRLGLAVLPEGKTIADYSEYQNFLASGEDCLCAAPWVLRDLGLKVVCLFHQDLLNRLLRLQRLTGIYATDLQLQDMRELTWVDICVTTAMLPGEIGIMKQLKPNAWSALMNAICAGHNTYCSDKGIAGDERPTLETIVQDELFQKHPVFTREDFFDHLRAAGFEHNLAFEISEFIRNGHTSDLRERHQKKLQEYGLPPDLAALAKQYAYIFPRAFGATYMLNFLRLAKYMKIDRRAFCKIVFE